MGEASEHHMREASGLRGERLIELRMRMTVGAGPPRRYEIEDLAAVCVVKRRTVRSGNQQRLRLGAVLGEGMPNVTAIARKEIAGERRLRGVLGVAVSLVGGVVH